MANKPNPYPKVPLKSWAKLRARAAAAPSVKMTGDTVAALLGMSSAKSAMDNIVYPLRRLGLIDEEGALTARGAKWRTDGGYSEACDEILADVYPESLSHLAGDDGGPDAAAIRTWFDQQGYGESNAKQMAATYLMIAGKEIPDPPAASGAGPKKAPPKKAPPKKAPAKAEPSESDAREKPGPANPADGSSGPSLHLDIQIHIPPDASADQLDRIFESMAKHLYNR